MMEDPDFVEKYKTDLCASLQNTVIEILMKKVDKAVKESGLKRLALSGGVSANSGLRNAFVDYGKRHNVEVFIPKFSYTTDNAAMVGVVGCFKYNEREFCGFERSVLFSIFDYGLRPVLSDSGNGG